ncbi:MAG: hypothetical protein NZ483_06290 [Verrucomicrobiae bacterium]|nr:hypothetical protein [Verrucomicrobiae bacterium]MDW8345265.1 hypothetical protein [Verrucomicrobiae bacterium]
MSFWDKHGLAVMAVLLGGWWVGSRLPGLIAPERFGEVLKKIPRAVWPGRILMAVVALWSGIRLYGAATDEWAWARGPVVVGVPLAYGLVIHFADQFLTVRAAAALMLLIANEALRAADWHPSPWRLVVTVLSYIWVVSAIWMAAWPYQFRDLVFYIGESPQRCWWTCGAGVTVGAFLLILAFTVY